MIILFIYVALVSLYYWLLQPPALYLRNCAIICCTIVTVTGCATVPEPSVIVKYETVIRTAPSSMYQLDNPVVDGDFTTQKGVADWIVRSEVGYQQCRDKINALQLYFSKDGP